MGWRDRVVGAERIANKFREQDLRFTLFPNQRGEVRESFVNYRLVLTSSDVTAVWASNFRQSNTSCTLFLSSVSRKRV